MAEAPQPGHRRGDARTDHPTLPAGQVRRTTAQDDIPLIHRAMRTSTSARPGTATQATPTGLTAPFRSPPSATSGARLRVRQRIKFAAAAQRRQRIASVSNWRLRLRLRLRNCYSLPMVHQGILHHHAFPPEGLETIWLKTCVPHVFATRGAATYPPRPAAASVWPATRVQISVDRRPEAVCAASRRR